MASCIVEAKWDAHPKPVPAFLDDRVFALEQSRGVWLHEASEKRDYLDLTNSFRRDELGYNHRRVRALRNSHPAPVACEDDAERLRERLVQSCGGLYDVGLFASLEQAYQWMIEAVLASKGRGGRALELSWDEDSHFGAECTSIPTLGGLVTKELENLFTEDEDPVAGLWVELPSVASRHQDALASWLSELQRICRSHGALLILNEAQTGFGRSGQWWDWQNFDLEPDLVVFGGGAKVSGVFKHTRHTELPSFAPLALDNERVVSSEVLLDVIEDEGLVGHAAVMGAYLSKVLTELELSFEQIVSVRGRGLRAAFELPSKAERDRVLEACLGENLILLPLGDRSVGICPPLDVRADAIGRAAAQLEVALQAVYEAEL